MERSTNSKEHFSGDDSSLEWNRFESVEIELSNFCRSQAAQINFHVLGIFPQLSHVHPQQAITQRGQIALAPVEHLQCASIIVAGDLIVSQADLQDALVEVAFGGLRQHPGFFQRFVGLIIVPLVEQLNAFLGKGMERINLRGCIHW